MVFEIKYIIILVLLQIGAITLYAQKEQVRGIYKTSDDFIKGHLSFDNHCNKQMGKIKLNDFFLRSYIIVTTKGNSSKYYKKEIFGYLNCRNQVFRFKGKQELLLVNASEQILIYKHIVSKTGTGRTNVTNYYFTRDIKSPLEILTIRNLKEAFSLNPVFHQFLDKSFKYNTDLAGFDKEHKMYRINWLLKESLK